VTIAKPPQLKTLLSKSASMFRKFKFVDPT
jgi:hypothetical protein